jgi:hypothetical protein
LTVPLDPSDPRPKDTAQPVTDDETVAGQLYAASLAVVQSTPGGSWILEACGGNLAVFVLIMEFALLLVHRRDSVGPLQPDGELGPPPYESWSIMCEDRAVGGSAVWLGKVRDAIAMIKADLARFDGQKPFEKPEDMAQMYKPEAEVQLTLKLNLVRRRLKDWKRHNWVTNKKLDDLLSEIGAKAEDIGGPSGATPKH